MAEQLIQTPSILFGILVNLPQEDLLLAQRVCRAWRDLITASKTLQIKLFLRPEEASQHSEDGAIELNGLLQARFPSFFTVDWNHDIGEDEWHSLGPCYSTDKLRSDPDPRRIAMYTRAEASWRCMIPCRPAPTEFQVTFSYQEDNQAGSIRCLRFSNRLPDGRIQQEQCSWLTFGLLYDIVKQGRSTRKAIKLSASNIVFDFSYSDSPHPATDAFRYQDPFTDPKMRLAAAFPEKKLGGPGIVLLHFNFVSRVWSCTNRPIHRNWPQPKVLANQFRFRGSDGLAINWDEKLDRLRWEASIS